MLTALVAFALAFHPAPAQPFGFVHFRSPSGNINCLGQPSGPPYVGCTLKQSTWAHKPAKPKTCDVDWDPTGIGLSHRRVSLGACRGDIGPLCIDPANPCFTLAYGKSVNIGPIRCTSATNGVTCRYRTAPHVGFRIAREGYVVYRS